MVRPGLPQRRTSLSAGVSLLGRERPIEPDEKIVRKHSSTDMFDDGLGLLPPMSNLWEIARTGDVNAFTEVYMDFVQSGPRVNYQADLIMDFPLAVSDLCTYDADTEEKLASEEEESDREKEEVRKRLGAMKARKGSLHRISSIIWRSSSSKLPVDEQVEDLTVKEEEVKQNPRFHCSACLIGGHQSICLFCAQHCHKGHDIRLDRASSGPLASSCLCGCQEHAFAHAAPRRQLDAHQNGRLPLSLAAEHGRLEMTELLLSYGASPNAKDTSGATPLLRACGGGHIDVVKALLAAGATVDCRELATGITPLHAACQTGHIELVELMLLHGVPADSMTYKMETPLFFAASRGMQNIVELLLSVEEVDVNVMTTDGRTAVHAALQRGNAEIVAMLVHNGANAALPMSKGNIEQSALSLVPSGKAELMARILFREAFHTGQADLVDAVLDYLPFDMEQYLDDDSSFAEGNDLLDQSVYAERGAALLVGVRLSSAAENYRALLALLAHKKCPNIRVGVAQTHLMAVNDVDVQLQVVSMQSNFRHRVVPSSTCMISLDRCGLTYLPNCYVEALRQFNESSGTPVVVLSLKHNRLRALPASLATVSLLRDVVVEGNPLDYVPEEHRKSWQKLKPYLRDMERRAQQWWRCKVITLGPKASGKSTIVRCLRKKGKLLKSKDSRGDENNGLSVYENVRLSSSQSSRSQGSPTGGNTEEAPTSGMRFTIWDLDTVALERGAHRMLVEHSAVILVTLNMADALSLFLATDLTDYEELGPAKSSESMSAGCLKLAKLLDPWMEAVVSYGRPTAKHVVFIVGTHMDVVPAAHLSALPRLSDWIHRRYGRMRYAGSQGLVCVNAKSGEGAKDLRHKIYTCATTEFTADRSEIPGSWVQLHELVHNTNALLAIQQELSMEARHKELDIDTRLLAVDLLPLPLLQAAAAHCSIVDQEQFNLVTNWLVQSGSILLYKLQPQKEQEKHAALRNLIILSPHWIAQLLADAADAHDTHGDSSGVLSASRVGLLFHLYPAALQPTLTAFLVRFNLLLPGKAGVMIGHSLLPSSVTVDLLEQHWPLVKVPEDVAECGRVLRLPVLSDNFFAMVLLHLLQMPGVSARMAWKTGAVLEYRTVQKGVKLSFGAGQDAEVCQALFFMDEDTKSLHFRLRNPRAGIMEIVDAVNTIVDTSYRQKHLLRRYVPCTHCILHQREALRAAREAGIAEEADALALLLRADASCFLFSYRECSDTISSSNADVFCHNIRSRSRQVPLAVLAPDVAFCGIPLIHPAQMVRMKVLGKGSFGTVYQARIKPKQTKQVGKSAGRGVAKAQSDVLVAVKELNLEVSEAEEECMMESVFLEFQAEVFVMSKLKHPNLVRLCGVCLAPTLQMILELLPEGNLFELLHPDTPEEGAQGTLPMIAEEDFPWELRLLIALDIAKGMAVLQNHNPPIVHRDLRSPNIFLASLSTSPATIRAKVADFGLARVVPDGISEVLDCWQWRASMSSDLFNSTLMQQYGSQSDVYSFGVICWELATRMYPYDGLHSNPKYARERKSGEVYLREQLVKADIVSKNLRPDMSFPCLGEEVEGKRGLCPSAFKQLIARCFSAVPEERPTFAEIVRDISSMASVPLVSSYGVEEAQPSASLRGMSLVRGNSQLKQSAGSASAPSHVRVQQLASSSLQKGLHAIQDFSEEFTAARTWASPLTAVTAAVVGHGAAGKGEDAKDQKAVCAWVACGPAVHVLDLHQHRTLATIAFSDDVEYLVLLKAYVCAFTASGVHLISKREHLVTGSEKCEGVTAVGGGGKHLWIASSSKGGGSHVAGYSVADDKLSVLVEYATRSTVLSLGGKFGKKAKKRGYQLVWAGCESGSVVLLSPEKEGGIREYTVCKKPLTRIRVITGGKAARKQTAWVMTEDNEILDVRVSSKVSLKVAGVIAGSWSHSPVSDCLRVTVDAVGSEFSALVGSKEDVFVWMATRGGAIVLWDAEEHSAVQEFCLTSPVVSLGAVGEETFAFSQAGQIVTYLPVD